MPPRLLTTPVRLTGPLSLGQLAVLATADADAREGEAEWLPAVLAGDLAGQYAAERELAREGHDRATLGRDEFVERVKAYEAECRSTAGQTFERLGLSLALDDLDAAVVDRDEVVRAARTAFVQLFEAGLLHRRELVVDTCPRCATVVDPVDAEPAGLDGERLVVRLETPDALDGLEVATLAPELLIGAVAVAVPPDHPAAGHDVLLPIANRPVPVLADPLADEPAFLVPAHDAAALDAARRLSLFPVEVLDDLGEVSQPGPLHRLGRFAARQAARDLLDAEGAVASTEPAPEAGSRCRRCGTVLVPRLGLHWFLDMTDLEVAAADQLREGVLDVSPPPARDELLARAGTRESAWCLSHQVWAGSPVPVSTCRDCGQVAVAAEQPTSCGKCMGELEADDSVLDARFLGAIWPLAATGWPDSRPDPEQTGQTALLVTPTGLIRWALPMAALGLRLAGTAPFARVTAVEVAADPDDPDPRVAADLDALIDEYGAEKVRTALMHGHLDLGLG
ncbi:MAG TPA: class I tRNA ligase family protein [Acidimicrobiales bacterium]|nr:class I tRNA ligase family protein [Acidimicrobiales bacterium]